MLHKLKHKLKQLLVPNRDLPLSTVSPLDIWLRDRIKGGGPTRIVQIGASDGSRNDPLRSYLEVPNLLLEAVLVEPLPVAFKALQHLYQSDARITLINAAIDEKKGSRLIYTITDDCPYVADQLTSFDRKHLLSNGVKARHIREVTVETITLDEMLNRCGFNSIDLMQVDTEGFDHIIVKLALELDEEKRPKTLNFEHNHIPQKAIPELFQHLKNCGYQWTNCDWDTFCRRA